jgi:broad specificity phosphatase PhoE
MSRLTLVRHGQARAFEDDPDRLSEAGEHQARKLGVYWAALGVRWSEVYCGTLHRQRRTAELIGEAYREAGIFYPAPRSDFRWNEYDSGGVLSRVAPVLSAREPAFAALEFEFHRHKNTPEANRHFQHMFEYLMREWIAGEVDAPGVESWLSFQTRVIEGLRHVINGSVGSRNVLIVSSGGPIATAVQTVVMAPSAMALELNWRIRNSSVTDFLFTQHGRITLDLFNTTPHLHAEEITYR